MESRNIRKYFLVLMVCALGISGCSMETLSKTTDDETIAAKTKQHVTVITKSTNSSYWKAVYAGAGAAATEYNLDLSLVGPAVEEDYETQNEMIYNAISNGTDAIVFSAIDFQENAEAVNEAIKAGVDVVVIDSDVNSDEVSCRISTDNYEAGRTAGKTALVNEAPELKIGIVNFDATTENGQSREKGFRDEVTGDERVTIVDHINVLSSIEEAKEGTIAMLEKRPDINVVVTFNEWTSIGVGYAIRELKMADSTTVVAFDSNVVCVDMLEKGEIDALIVQNPYAMGYLGVETAYQVMNGAKIEETIIDTATKLVTKENMYTEECQRMLFLFDD